MDKLDHEKDYDNDVTDVDGGVKTSTLTSPPQRRAAHIVPVAIMLLLLGAAVVVGLFVGSSITKNGSPISPPRGIRVGATAPDFELNDVRTGQPVKLSTFKGRPVWINFWATWCPPCKAELPRMKEKYEKYIDSGLVIVGVDMREEPAAVSAFTRSNGYDWIFVVDTDGQIANRYFTEGIPTHLFIDAEGVIQAVHVGDLEAGAMEELLRKILGTVSTLQ